MLLLWCCVGLQARAREWPSVCSRLLFQGAKENTMKKMNVLVRYGVGASLAAVAGVASAATDYSGLVTATTGEINAGITAALPVAALVLGAMIGFKIFKRFARG